MWCGIVTLFPAMFQALTGFGVTGRACDQGLLNIQCWDPRDFAEDNYKTVDDRPYGGGPGMVMSVYPLRHAIQAARKAAEERLQEKTRLGGKGPRLIYVSPQGRRLDQAGVKELLSAGSLLFVAGRYEGIDERLMTLEPGEEWSLGDYVLSGGELAVMVMIDALARLIPGVLGHQASAILDSFSSASGLLDHPHYTRPETIEELSVPEALLSGDHAAIRRWRLKQQLGRTWLRRPDLFKNLNLDEENQLLLQEFIAEQ